MQASWIPAVGESVVGAHSSFLTPAPTSYTHLHTQFHACNHPLSRTHMHISLTGQLDVRAGGEFVAARRAVEALQAGAADGSIPDAPMSLSIILGDRPAQETLRAMWSALRPTKRLGFVGSILRSLLFDKVRRELRRGHGQDV